VGKPAATEPIRIQLERGKSYAWCACGSSSRQVNIFFCLEMPTHTGGTF